LQRDLFDTRLGGWRSIDLPPGLRVLFWLGLRDWFGPSGAGSRLELFGW